MHSAALTGDLCLHLANFIVLATAHVSSKSGPSARNSAMTHLVTNSTRFGVCNSFGSMSGKSTLQMQAMCRKLPSSSTCDVRRGVARDATG